MAKPAAAVAPQHAEDPDRVDTLLPAHHEQLIDLDKLHPAPDDWNFFGFSRMNRFGQGIVHVGNGRWVVLKNIQFQGSSVFFV